ncbi:phage baseplate assembly protein V [Aquipseudomonas ullengensis]|uniref:Baseplate assembly protein n=1 Tax=Aquipseudomonas ullengensis TaxID=2759166 RepID=A0A7W4QFH7_9GAMM|nr:phage baseplate assembly protein V [Pseudomonas ullengensis]MBB2496653.1 baseplate assembly protein [Pseudomonas ullengensis]
MSERDRFFGKYRGVVLNNIDPMQSARIQVQVPDVLGPTLSSWAMPCVPFAGQQSGVFVLPKIGAGVWVEFERGDADYPVWVGGFWGSAAEVPALALAGLPVSPSIVLQTGNQTSLMLSDLPGPTGGILLKTATGAMISINEVGITISNGQGATIMLTGPSVNINQGALTVI